MKDSDKIRINHFLELCFKKFGDAMPLCVKYMKQKIQKLLVSAHKKKEYASKKVKKPKIDKKKTNKDQCSSSESSSDEN